jgi:hypothetical protein
MTHSTVSSEGPRLGGAMAAVAAIAMLATACGPVHASVSGGSASTGSATFRANLAYAHCMRTHGVSNFPIPNSLQHFTISGHPGGPGTSPTARANDACEHLLPPATTSTDHVTQQQLNAALKVVQCLRTHGAPNFPDPTVVNGSLNFSVNLQSAQFQDPLNACRSLIPKGTKLP